MSAVLYTTRASLMPCAADGGSGYSSVVDIFNVTTGRWTIAALSQARSFLAATSLSVAGVFDLAIFAGGYCTSCDFCLRCCRMGMSVRGMREWVECGFVYDASQSHALCSGRWKLFQCCGHLQRDVWTLDHCSPQPGSTQSCSRVAAECRSRDLRWRRMYVL